jgi:hypothetical protein
MNTQKAAQWLGIILIVIGILGFIPGATTDGRLLGILEVDTVHNGIHLLSGIIALICARSASAAKGYLKAFGVVYALVTLVGFLDGSSIFDIFSVNGAGNILHLLIAAVALYIGFSGPKTMSAQPM